ncbi:MAG: LD-carboxypeptidase [Bacteroidales bacterium]|nr:LD-carboxypeptidase [Bacteroidales bacterium]
MNNYEPLSKGDTIAIVAPARRPTQQEIDIAYAKLQSWGLNVVLGEHLFCSDNQYAGTDTQRASDLNAALQNPNVKAILCARGGYGGIRILDKIDFSVLNTTHKWLCGYSDTTVFHAHLNQQNISTLHCTMPINFPEDGSTDISLQTLHDYLFGKPIHYTIPAHGFNRIGNTTGQLIGCNLSILYSLLGSPNDFSFDNKILFIEDVGEYLYHIDRMIFSLKRAGKLTHLAGLIVGGMSDMNDNAIPFGKTPYEIVAEHTAEYNYPICFGFPAGHIPENYALPLGIETSLTVTQDGVTLQQF